MSQYYDSTQAGTKPAPEHDLIMRGRRLIDITGVKQVESFDNE
ncbi:sporulation protein YabP, partial [Bacillus obstructivus]